MYWMSDFWTREIFSLIVTLFLQHTRAYPLYPCKCVSEYMCAQRVARARFPSCIRVFLNSSDVAQVSRNN